MKYLIRIENNKAYLYEGDSISYEGDNMIPKKPEGSKRYIGLSEPASCKKLWDWIKDNTGWTKNNRLDVVILAESSDQNAVDSLLAEANHQNLGAMAANPTAWTESGIQKFLNKVITSESLITYEAKTHSFLFSSGKRVIHVTGLYENFVLRPGTQGPVVLPRRKPNSTIRKAPVKESVKTDNSTGRVYAKPVNPRPEEEDKHKPKLTPTKMGPFPKHGTVTPGKNVEISYPQATDEQRQKFINEQAKDFVYTVANKDAD